MYRTQQGWRAHMACRVPNHSRRFGEDNCLPLLALSVAAPFHVRQQCYHHPAAALVALHVRVDLELQP